MKKVLFGISILLCTFKLYAQPGSYDIVKEIITKNKGVVSSAHPLASEAGARMFDKGGSAFDAAIATQWVLAVVYPQAGNIGGGGFMVGVTRGGKKLAMDYRETAPAAAHRDMYLDANGKAQTELSQNGRLAAGIPGTVAGLFEMYQYARLSMWELMQPAIDLAEKGFTITKREADLLNQTQKDFVRYNSNPVAFLKDTEWKAGDLLVQKELAETLKCIQKEGVKGFYEGRIAKLIVAEMERGNGIITLKDLSDYRVIHRKPLAFKYKGYKILSMPMPSSGGILLAQMLGMTRLKGLSNKTLNSPEAVQLMVEAERRAYADRAKYMGDPAFIKDETKKLISRRYMKKRFRNYNPVKATPSSDVGEVMTPKESEQTTHLSVLDKEGNAVSVTTTLNGLYGCKTVVAGAGFLLNNEMDDFSIKPGVPNMYGAIGGDANAIQPNKRMLSSMTPTVVLKRKQPRIVVGTPGGTTIPTSVFQSIVNIIDFKKDAKTAVDAPKFHHQWLPEVVYVESDFPEATVKALEKMNYTVEPRANIGRVEMIVKERNGKVRAVADKRGDDAVASEQ